MADRHANESSFGNPGRLSYLPNGTQQAEECGLQTGRNHDPKALRFGELGPSHQWFAASRNDDPPSSNGQQARKQKVWLLKNYPIASLGNDFTGELSVSTATSSNHHDRSQPLQLAQFALGEMTDTSDPQRTGGVPLLAMAGGAIGDVLRFVKPSVEDWQWTGDESTSLRLFGCSDPQEMQWSKQVGVIRRIKSVVSSKRFEPVRLLIAQRDRETSVFQPEFQRAPMIAEKLQEGSVESSRIAPNLLTTVTKAQTGGQFHSDVAFNPGVRSRPPQLALIDEVGNWTVWDMKGIRNKMNKRPKTTLTRCGSIEKGVTGKVPHEPATNAQVHRISWVGRSASAIDDDDGFDEENMELQPPFAYPPLERSSVLLLANSQTLRLLDLDTNAFLPSVNLITEGGTETLLDVCINTHDPRYFFVATTTRLVVMGVFWKKDTTQDDAVKQVSILYSAPHMRNKFDQTLRIAVTPAPQSSEYRTSLVVLYSSESRWFDIFCVNMFKGKHARITCHRDTIVSGGLGCTINRALQTLHIAPALMTSHPVPGLSAAAYRNNRTRFFQLFSLSTNLSMSCALGACSTEPLDHLVAPDRKIDGVATLKKDRRRVLRYLSSLFVVPDSNADFQTGRPVIPLRKSRKRLVGTPQRLLRDVHELISSTIHAEHGEHFGSSLEMEIYSAAPFEPIYATFQAALHNRALPLKTLYEMLPEVKVPEDIDEASSNWSEEIQQLQGADPALRVVNLMGMRSGSVETSLQDIYSAELYQLNVTAHNEDESEGQQNVIASIARQIASELYMSQYGMMYRREELFIPPESASQGALSPMTAPDNTTIESQEEGQSTATTPINSTFSMGTLSTSLPFAVSQPMTPDNVNEREDHNIALIRAFTGTGKSLPAKNTKVLSMWKMDEDLDRYVFSIDKIVDVTPGMLRRARQEAKEARKRKRAETLLQMLQSQRGNSVQPATQPVPEHSRFAGEASQPLSLFSQGQVQLPLRPQQTMSQPLAGVFGRRAETDRPKKKVKRKGGF